jgi:hypothetical protein
MVDDGNNAAYNSFMYVGAYQPLSSSYFVTSSGGNAQMPMVMHSNYNNAYPLLVGSTYGDLAGNASTNGGIVGPNTGSAEVRFLRTDRYGTNLMVATSLEPNPQFNPAAFDEFKIPLIMFESPGLGHVGYFDLITEVFNIPVHSTNADLTRASFGAGGGNVNIVTPWSGSAPASTSTQGGRQF